MGFGTAKSVRKEEYDVCHDWRRRESNGCCFRLVKLERNVKSGEGNTFEEQERLLVLVGVVGEKSSRLECKNGCMSSSSLSSRPRYVGMINAMQAVNRKQAILRLFRM